jgi:ATP-dependent DNA helicase RecQ
MMGAMTPSPVIARAQELLVDLAGPSAVLRPEQADAIEAVVADRRRALVVQRTGFGKSAIYFIATRLLRDAGAGPTLVVSPLLALMRDQVAAAERMGVRSATINSTNIEDWRDIEKQLAAGDIDLLCISPERLNNPGFVHRVLPELAAGLGLLVVDEAHCISDWGHDFRPDYRRIRDAIANLPPGTPVIATTATANARVTADVAEQLGSATGTAEAGGGPVPSPGAALADDVLVLRGSLDRESLHLGVVRLDSAAERLAWLAQRIPQLDGSGIVYCLTVAQTAVVADFLTGQGIDAAAYSGDTPPDERQGLERRFKDNDIKVLAATSALGMGVDKPDVTFVLHLGAPPSPIAYYQQVGRAGRSVPRAEAWLLPSEEDRAIWAYFASVGLPPEDLLRRTLDALGDQPVSLPVLERTVDLRRGRLENMLKILDVDGAVERVDGGWIRTNLPYEYDRARVTRIEEARRAEAAAMVTYATAPSCLMAFLRQQLDDPAAEPCGRCGPCTGATDPVTLDPAVVRAAVEVLRGIEVVVEPRKRWPAGLDAPRGTIKPADRAEVGRTLCRVADAGWWPAVRHALDEGEVDDELLAGVARVLKRWPWSARPTWVTWIPSRTHEAVLADLATKLGRIGKLEVRPALQSDLQRPRQDVMENSVHRLANVWGSLRAVEDGVPAGPVLVLDDVIDSGWTMTVAAAELRRAGVPAVLPFALARR